MTSDDQKEPGLLSQSAEKAAQLAEAAAAPAVAVAAPVRDAVRADVSSLARFLRGIQSGYLLVGIGLYVATAIVGMVVVLTGSFSDWFMHLGQYVVLFAFVLLYVRAHQLGYRVSRAIYAVLTLLLLGYFAWILADLVPARQDVLSRRPLANGLTGPEVVIRPEAGALWIVVAGLAVVFVWLAAHWLVLGRFRNDDPRRARA